MNIISPEFLLSSYNFLILLTELAAVVPRAGQLGRAVGVLVAVLVQRIDVVGGGAVADEVHRPGAAQGVPLLEEVPDLGQGQCRFTCGDRS